MAFRVASRNSLVLKSPTEKGKVVKLILELAGICKKSGEVLYVEIMYKELKTTADKFTLMI